MDFGSSPQNRLKIFQSETRQANFRFVSLKGRKFSVSMFLVIKVSAGKLLGKFASEVVLTIVAPSGRGP